jgi:hypothetical protein
MNLHTAVAMAALARDTQVRGASACTAARCKCRRCGTKGRGTPRGGVRPLPEAGNLT